MSLLSCQNVVFSYDGKCVLSKINFTVERGDYLCIVGENGAGKSTLVKGILNLKKPVMGSILTGEGLSFHEIGYLPQQTGIQKDFPASVYEVVQSGRLNKLGFHFYYGKEDQKQIQKNMEQLKIWEMRHQCYRELSGGQQQRVLLARALCSTKKMLMLDEPVSGLDPVMTNEMYQIIEQLNKEEKITIIMVSHDVKNALPYATHILHLGQSQLFFGTKEEYRNTALGKYFGIGDQL